MSKKYTIKRTEYTSKAYRYTDSQAETRRYLIEFYTRQYHTFTDIGIGRQTRFGVKITEKLIQCTANRLDQIKNGKKTFKNMCRIDRIMSMLERTNGNIPEGEPAHLNSNRSFIGHVTSKFHTLDLGKNNRLSMVDQGDPPIDHTHYIDKVSTAYNSEIMQAVLSHDS